MVIGLKTKSKSIGQINSLMKTPILIFVFLVVVLMVYFVLVSLTYMFRQSFCGIQLLRNLRSFLRPPSSRFSHLLQIVLRLFDFIPCFNLNGFGYDHIADDYKVICHATFYIDYLDPHNDELSDKDSLLLRDKSFCPIWEIYSLRSKSWRKLDVNIFECDAGLVTSHHSIIRVYMDGVCHWVCGYCEEEKFISLVSFDLNNEMFCITPVPSDHKLHSTQLMVLNGSIALISSHEKTKTIRISILGEVGVKESWIKLFVVERPYVGFPIRVGMKGEIFFEKEDNEIVWFDLTTNMIK